MKKYIDIMSEDYLYAVQRAELLGQTPPTEEEWAISNKVEDNNHNDDVDDDAVVQNLEDADNTARQIGGRLDELNTILSTTQKKINRLKIACGSLGSLFKVRSSNSRSVTPEHKPLNQSNNTITSERDSTIEPVNLTNDPNSTPQSDYAASVSTHKKIDINEKMGSHLDKLDSLISKAENAQYSMQHQTKMMKKIIKK